MSNKNLKNWLIKDSLFYPLGLFNNSSRMKTVFVTWSYNRLLTFIFKKAGNSTTLRDTFEISLKGVIHDVVATEVNTFCLTKAGYVYYFSSCKSLKRIELLDGVRCISTISEGFAVIRVTKENRIILETYNDFTDSADLRRSRCFDISFDDENLLNSTWNDESFCLYSIQITTENRKFLELLTKQTIPGNELFLFAINNNLFGLLEHASCGRGDECSIILIHTLPSEIESIKFVSDQNFIVIVMKCGVLEMIFHSKQFDGIDRAVHILDGDIMVSSFSGNCFYYSDGSRVVQCKLVCDDSINSIACKKTEKPVRGIVALTWVSTTRRLICLSDNNMFYRLRFDDNKKDSDEDAFAELDDKKMKEIKTHFGNMVSLLEEPKQIQSELKAEYAKQQLLSVQTNKALFSDMLQTKVSFHKTPPDLSGIVIYPLGEKILTGNTYFAIVDVKVESHAIFNSGLWRLCIELFGDLQLFKSFLVSADVLSKSIKVLLQIEKGKILIIPEIRVSLSSYVDVAGDLIYITLIAKNHIPDIQNLFTSTLRSFVDPCQESLDDKMLSITKGGKNSQMEFSSKLKTPLLVILEELYEIFNLPSSESSAQIEQRFTVYLVGVEIRVEYFELENSITVSCQDPGALFYTKSLLARLFYSEIYNDDITGSTKALQLLQKLRAELQSKSYGNLQTSHFSNALKKIYLTLRKGVMMRI